MSNDEYMKLYKKFENMIYKLCLKWSKLNIIEFDDLMQFALLELVHAAKTYDPTRGTKFSTYLYSLLNYRLRREIQKVKEKNKIKTVSIYSTVTSDEGSTAELIDIIADNLDLEEEIQNKLIMNYYESECKRVLDDDFEVAYLRWFKNMPYQAIESILSIDKAAYRVNNCRRKLIQKSRVFHDEYMKLIGINDYSSTERAAIM